MINLRFAFSKISRLAMKKINYLHFTLQTSHFTLRGYTGGFYAV